MNLPELYAWRRWTLRVDRRWPLLQLRRRVLVHWQQRPGCRLANADDLTTDGRSMVNCPACLAWRTPASAYLGMDRAKPGAVDQTAFLLRDGATVRQLDGATAARLAARLATADRLAAAALREAVRERLRAGLAQGLSASALAACVAAALEESDPQRAARIARSEIASGRKGKP